MKEVRGGQVKKTLGSLCLAEEKDLLESRRKGKGREGKKGLKEDYNNEHKYSKHV